MKFIRETELNIDVSKYRGVERRDSNLKSRNWLNEAMKISTQKNLDPPNSSRLYAYIASIYADVLDQSSEQQADIATYLLLKKLEPEYATISANLKAFENSNDLLEDKVEQILDKYLKRIEEDNSNLVWDKKIPDQLGAWYTRDNEIDGGAKAGEWLLWNANVDLVEKFLPPETGSVEDYLELEKVKLATAIRKDNDLAKIYFSSTGFHKGENGDNISPAGAWQNILYKEKGYELNNKEYAKAQKILAQSLADSLILAWKIKYEYWTQRPSMRIKDLSLAIADPPFPSYVSGHSVISYTAAGVLSILYHDKAGLWAELANQVKDTRLRAGVHFDADNQNGALLGLMIAEKTLPDKTFKLDLLEKTVKTIPENKLLSMIDFLAFSAANWIYPKIEYVMNQAVDLKYTANKYSCARKVNESVGFEDITKRSGVDFSGDWVRNNIGRYTKGSYQMVTDDYIFDNHSGGVVTADFNNDSYADIYFVTGDGGQLYINKGDLTFYDASAESGIKPFLKATGATAADYDNDGNIDLLIYGYKTSPLLYKNLGKGKFADATEELGLKKEGLISFGAAFGDYDNDGYLDLFLANYFDWPEAQRIVKTRAQKGEKHLLFKNLKGAKFKDVSKEAGIEGNGSGLAVSFIDYNQDGLQDIILANDVIFNTLFKNLGNGKFVDDSEKGLVQDTSLNNGMGLALGDYNRDGYTDIFMSNVYRDQYVEDPGGNLLFINNKGANFENKAKASRVDGSGWNWGTVPIDQNNDGYEDIAVVGGFNSAGPDQAILAMISRSSVKSRAYLYISEGNKGFEEKACELGFYIDENARGLALADFNNDGYSDLVLNNLRRQPKIFINRASGNNWIKVKLRGGHSNKNGVGAKVWVTSKSLTQFKELQTSGSYLSGSELVLSFGLGGDNSVEQIKIVWPSGKTQILKDLRINKVLEIFEE